MNILVLNYEYPPLGGGAAPDYRDLAVGMAREGHQVAVVTMGVPTLPVHEMCDGVEIFRLKCLRRKEHSCMPWEQFTYIMAAKRFLKNHLKTRRYDVCHTHFIIPTGPVAKWVKRTYGIPYVLTAHGSDVEGYNEKKYIRALHRILRPAWKQIVREADAVAAPSGYLMKLMKDEMRWNRYIRIPNGLDIDRFRAERSEKKKRILLMGRMQEAKNFQTVLKSLSLIPKALWNGWCAEILGDGPYRPELEKLVKDLGIGDRTAFRGWVENGSATQLEYLKQSAIYISASHFENCPMAVLEAAAAGCRLLLSDIEGHRQFFGGADDCFFPADDAEKLAQMLSPLLEKEPEALFSERSLEDYRIGRVTDQYLKLLEASAENNSDSVQHL